MYFPKKILFKILKICLYVSIFIAISNVIMSDWSQENMRDYALYFSQTETKISYDNNNEKIYSKGKRFLSRLQGERTTTYPNGTIMKTRYVNNKKHGRETMTYLNGTSVEEFYIHGKIQPLSIETLKTENNNKIILEKVNNITKKMTQLNADGTTGLISEGEFSGDVRHGKQRILLYPDGEIQEGNFVNGIAEGERTSKYDGIIFKFNMVNGIRQEDEERTLKDGSIHKGKVINGLEQGKRTIKYLDGSIRIGEMIDGKSQGKWQYTSGDIKAEMLFKDGKGIDETINILKP